MHRVLYVQILFIIGLFGCDPNWGKKACDPNLPPGIPGCCPDETKTPGTEGAECRADSPTCDDDMVCYAGTCHPCGEVGQTCCKPSGQYGCDPGIDCDNTSNVPYPTCVGCGSIGSECCPGDACPGGGTCTNGTCEAPIDPSCWSGNMAVTVTIIDGTCAAQTFVLKTNTVAEAEACAQQLLALAQSDPAIVQPVEVGPIGATPSKTPMCKNVNDPFGTVKMYHFTQSQLQACQNYYCDTCPWTAGQCPP